MIPTYIVSGLGKSLMAIDGRRRLHRNRRVRFAQESGAVPALALADCVREILHPYFVAVLYRQLFASGGSQNR